jgi:hypothetical protein
MPDATVGRHPPKVLLEREGMGLARVALFAGAFVVLIVVPLAVPSVRRRLFSTPPMPVD